MEPETRPALLATGQTAALRYQAAIDLVADGSVLNLPQSQHCFYPETILRGTY